MPRARARQRRRSLGQALAHSRDAQGAVPALELVQGTHLVLDGPPQAGIYYLESPRDGRAIFVMPWREQLLLGTTEVRFHGDPAAVAPGPHEIHYLLGVLRHYFPRFRDAAASQVQRAFAGLRVLPAAGGHAFHRSRETLLVTDRDSRPRLLSIYGGKLTTWRAVSARALRQSPFPAAAPPRGTDRPTGTASLMSHGVLALDQGSHASRACIFDESGALCATASVPVSTRRPGDAAGRTRRRRAGQQLAQSGRRCSAGGAPSSRGWRWRPPASPCSAQQSCAARVSMAARSPPQFPGRTAAMPPGWSAWRRTRRACVHSPVCRSHRTTEPARSAGAWTTWRQRAAPRRRANCWRRHWRATSPCISAAARAADSAGADAANAARTQLFDSQRLDWSGELLELFGIERAWLPPCTSTREDWGTLQLPGYQVPLRAVTGDQSAVPYASGDPDPATVYVNLGTGAFIQRPLQFRPASPEPLLGSVLSRAAVRRSIPWRAPSTAPGVP